jgi:hypothetical protein
LSADTAVNSESACLAWDCVLLRDHDHHTKEALRQCTVRTGTDTGLGHLSSRHEKINAVWTELLLLAADLLALAQSMLLVDEPDLHRADQQPY